MFSVLNISLKTRNKQDTSKIAQDSSTICHKVRVSPARKILRSPSLALPNAHVGRARFKRRPDPNRSCSRGQRRKELPKIEAQGHVSNQILECCCTWRQTTHVRNTTPRSRQAESNLTTAPIESGEELTRDRRAQFGSHSIRLAGPRVAVFLSRIQSFGISFTCFRLVFCQACFVSLGSTKQVS